MQQNPLEHIGFEKINDVYCYGRYGDGQSKDDIIVIMRKKDGYINATRLCHDISKKLNTNREFKFWNRLDIAHELKKAVGSSVHMCTDDLLNTITGGQVQEIRGTYVHPDLIPHIASWASPQFAVKVSRIVNKYFNDKQLKIKDKIIRQQQSKINEHKDRIDELIEKMDKQSEEARLEREKADQERQKAEQERIEARERYLKLKGKAKRANKHLSELKEMHQEVTQQNEELLQKMDGVLEDRVVKPDHLRDQHSFVVMKDPNEDPKTMYYAIRTKKKIVKPTVKRYIESHRNAVVLVQIDYNPNSINLWDRIRTTLKKNIKCRLNAFGLVGDFTEEQLIEQINDINEEKFNVELD